jgi:hypothetical protein
MSEKDIVEYCFRAIQLIFPWPIMIALLLFTVRREIPLLVQRLSGLEVGGVKVAFTKPETMKTPIGKTNVSAVPSRPANDSYSFYSQRYQFRISWPLQEWELNLEPEEIMKKVSFPYPERIALIIGWHQSIGGFQPNVNIMVDPIGDMSLKDYMAFSLKGMIEKGFKVQLYRVDEKTGGGVFVYLQEFLEKKLYQITRVTTYNGLAYVVTASVLYESLSPQLAEKISEILNSFEVVPE